MKILVSTDTGQKVYPKIATYLSRIGHTVFEDDNKISKKDPKKDLAKLENHIKNAEVIIIDVSEPNFKTGYVISRALADKKVVIGLEKAGKKEKAVETQPFLFANKSRNLLLYEYESEKKADVEELVDRVLNDAKKRLDTKFILIISPEIDSYLDWVSQNKRMHKAQVVRNAIESAMRKDKEYKEYLGDTE